MSSLAKEKVVRQLMSSLAKEKVVRKKDLLLVSAVFMTQTFVIVIM